MHLGRPQDPVCFYPSLGAFWKALGVVSALQNAGPWDMGLPLTCGPILLLLVLWLQMQRA